MKAPQPPPADVRASSQEVDDLHAIFDHFDHNKDGKLSIHEISSSLDKLGLAVPIAELSLIVTNADTNCDGCVDYTEFTALYHTLIQGKFCEDVGAPLTPEEADLKEAFRVFDKDDDGYIRAEELYSVLSSMGILKGRTLQDCRKMISKVDADGDGQVDFEEFKQMMTSGAGMG